MLPQALTVTLCALALGVCACGGRVAKPDATETPMQPTLTHDALVEALERHGDASLAALLANEGDYWAEPVPFDGLVASRIFRVVPNDTSEPVDFLFAVDVRTGRAAMTSQSPVGVAGVVFAEAALVDDPALPRLAFELIRPRAVALTFLASAEDVPVAERSVFAAPTRVRDGERVRLTFQVLDEERVIEWRLELTPPASGTLKTRQLTTAGAR